MMLILPILQSIRNSILLLLRAKQREAKAINSHIVGIINTLLILTSQHNIMFHTLNLLRQEKKLSPINPGHSNLSFLCKTHHATTVIRPHTGHHVCPTHLYRDSTRDMCETGFFKVSKREDRAQV